MAVYEYSCKKGHVTSRFQNMKDSHPKTVKCDTCPGRANRIFSKPAVVDDFPEHFNISLGEVVKNRAHLKRIQAERGLQDWEPTRDSPGSQLSRERC